MRVLSKMSLKLVGSKMEELGQIIAASGSGAASASGKSAILYFIKTNLFGIFAFVGASIVSLASMILLEPQSKKEKFICFVSTFICAYCLSSALTLYYGMHFPETSDGRLAHTGLVIVSGAPGWVLVRGFYLTVEKFKGKDIGQIVSTIKGWFK